jgi:hypothetical protein
MTPEQARAARRVINSARAFERAGHYGINSTAARHEYDEARAEQARLRVRRAVA